MPVGSDEGGPLVNYTPIKLVHLQLSSVHDKQALWPSLLIWFRFQSGLSVKVGRGEVQI